MSPDSEFKKTWKLYTKYFDAPKKYQEKIFSKGKSNIERQISKKDLNWSLKQIWAKTCKLIKINCNI